MKIKFVRDANEINLNDERMIGLDIETSPVIIDGVDKEESIRHGTDPRLSKIRLVQVCVGDVVYIMNGGFESLRCLLEDGNVIKVIHTASFEYKFFWYLYKIEIVNMVDVAIFEGVVNSGKSKQFSLKALTKVYLGIDMDKGTRDQFIEGRSLTKQMIEYAALDAWVLVRIYQEQMKIVYDGVKKVASLEFKLIPAVTMIELRGIKLDEQEWLSVYTDKKDELSAVVKNLSKFDTSGVKRVSMFGGEDTEKNYNSRLEKLKMLEQAGITDLPDLRYPTMADYYAKTGNGLVRLFLEYSKLEKATTTYGEEFLNHVNPVTKRIHQHIRQVEARTGRLAGRDPNLMNIPKDRRYRRCFIASRGKVLVAVDYSQQELRILAEYCNDKNLLYAFENNIDVHLHVARILFHDKDIDAEDPRRKAAKNLNFGLVYGMGPAKLAKSLKTSLADAKNLMLIHSREFPRVFSWMNESIQFAKDNGYVTTLLGRRRYLDTTSFDYERQARNTPIQGSAADMTKIAVLLFDERHTDEETGIVNIIHDEICVETNEENGEDVFSYLKDDMLSAAKLLVKSVPFGVDGYINNRWIKRDITND